MSGGRGDGAARTYTYHTYRIVGETTVEQYPSVVQVDFLLPNIGWDQMCAGTILTPLVVVSAANCFLGNVAAERRRIRAGSSIRNSGGTIIGLRSYRNHPEFQIQQSISSIMNNNMMKKNAAVISLLYLAQQLVFSASVQPASIPPKEHLPSGSSVTLASWGRSVVMSYGGLFKMNVCVNEEPYSFRGRKY
ncbi:trypsin, alkaline C-like [Plutella xylostella]|uniref:trypsin, alkaline C-like n=1 Tax=Plutella xylostella TaxID=51655 RepID=UPI00203245C2|nr:trypsin, alkaline C-like [Plutella xylostella]